MDIEEKQTKSFCWPWLNLKLYIYTHSFSTSFLNNVYEELYLILGSGYTNMGIESTGEF